MQKMLLLDEIKIALEFNQCTKILDIFNNDDKIKRAYLTESEKVRRLLINQFFNLLLIRYPDDTRNAREKLINDGSEVEWFRLFNKYIIDKLVNIEQLL
jgi:hypothetical protein